ncbi:bifunctional diguanylate cyclase/phosphodiesterase [Shewanella sp. SR44-3]|uniref:putative bifunctional diguanylate cyclase/phosphodiesterase n=1 Tax=Shewanella sp. SR44-3 TaxID=2760936 RepID=UPI0021758DDC|nr:GGDEF and EAL domain-containing protein [Shewanella sp. SR44-3]
MFKVPRLSLIVTLPVSLVILFASLILGEYWYERKMLGEQLTNTISAQLQQDLFRMRIVVDSAIATHDMQRIEQEVSLVATEQDMMVYVLLDASSQIRYANHVIWRNSNAANVLEAYSAKTHHEAVTQDKPITQVDFESLSIQVYYPIYTSSRSRYSNAIDVIYLEYSIATLLFEAIDQLQQRLETVWGFGVLFILLFYYVFYRLHISPLRRLSRAAKKVGAADFQSESAFWSAELSVLHHFLTDVDARLKRATQRLNDAERRWLFSVEGSRNGIWDWNIATGAIFVSDRWKEILGFDANDTTNDYSAWETRLHPDEKSQVLNTLQNYINHQKEDYESVHRLKHKQGHYIWVLDKGKIVEWDELARPIRIIGTITDVSGDVQHHRIAIDKQSHNGLTDLINRDALANALFDQQVECRQNETSAALLLIRLDNFSVINDALGRQLGDRLLMQIAARLTSTFNAAGLIARLGAEEFVILANALGKDSEQANRRALALASEVRHLIGKGFTVSDQHLSISAKVGLVVFDGLGSVEPHRLLTRADTALSHAADAGGCVLYQASMDKNQTQPAKLQQALSSAIENEHLSLAFQPVVDGEGNVGSIEVLIRWYHIDYGFINPSKIIAIAELSDDIVKLELWVFEQVRALMLTLEHQQIALPVFSINISARSFHHDDFIPQLKQKMHQYPLNAGLIQLELEEEVFNVNPQDARNAVLELQELGFLIALDNFGLSMGTLQYLQGVTFSQVKLAQRYLDGISESEENIRLLDALVHMARCLDYPVVAKYLENKELLKIVTDMQCAWFQGYIISRPLVEKDIVQLIKSKLSLSVG